MDWVWMVFDGSEEFARALGPRGPRHSLSLSLVAWLPRSRCIVPSVVTSYYSGSGTGAILTRHHDSTLWNLDRYRSDAQCRVSRSGLQQGASMRRCVDASMGRSIAHDAFDSGPRRSSPRRPWWMATTISHGNTVCKYDDMT